MPTNVFIQGFKSVLEKLGLDDYPIPPPSYSPKEKNKEKDIGNPPIGNPPPPKKPKEPKEPNKEAAYLNQLLRRGKNRR